MWCEQPGFVLHRRAYRETSLLVSLLTPEQGRVDAVVKGVRAASNAARRKNAWLQPFQPLDLRWRERASGLVTLAQFEPGDAPVRLNHTALACGLYMNELLLRALPQRVAIDALFEQYGATLALLAEHPQPQVQGWLLRQFERTLLETLGVPLLLPGDALDDRRYRWVAGHGLVAATEGCQARCIRALLEGRFEPGCGAQQKRLLRQMLAEWLGPKPLRSVEMLQQMIRKPT